MKNPLPSLRYLGVCFGVTVVLASQAATLVVNPSVVSNTYLGPILLSIGGLTNGEQVAIQHYLDLNGNGSPDSGEPMIDAFRIRDGGAYVIGGVTNRSVPWDSDPAAGAITAVVTFVPGAGLDSFVGGHIFQLESPTGRFLPQLATLSVTNSALACTLSGSVSSGGLQLPNAVVVALTLANQNLAGGIISDALGHYSLKLNPGSYFVMSVMPGYYTDQSAAPQVTLAGGASSNVDLYITNAQGSGNSISGRVSDAGTSNALGGVFVQLEANALFTLAFSDRTGAFTAPVIPAQWGVRPDGPGLAHRAYVAPQNRLPVDTSTGSVAGVQIPLTHGNAMFYGRITDATGAPVGGLDVYGQDNAQQYQADAYSDTNGFYYLSVVANNSNWYGSPDTQNSSALAQSLVSTGLGWTNISANQAVRQDFHVLPATASISGKMLDNNGAAVANVGLSANGTVSGYAINSYTTTGPDGSYFFNAGSGTWNLYANCCGYQGLDSFGLTDLFQHTITIPPTNATLNITVYPFGTSLLSPPIRQAPTRYGMFLSGTPGINYRLQASVNLTNWFEIWSGILPYSSYYVEDSQATNSQRFYRVR